MAERTETVRQLAAGGDLTTAEMLEALARFEGPPEQFLAGLLAVQCRVGAAQGGAILRLDGGSRADVVAAWPALSEGAAVPGWLTRSAEFATQVLGSGKTAVKELHAADDLYGGPARRHLVLIPLRNSGFPGLASFVVEAQDPSVVAAARERLEMSAGFLGLYEMRMALQRRQADLQRLRDAMELLPAINEHDRFVAAAMALCNEASARWSCDRASVGFLKERYVRLRAMSHTEKFSRRMKLVQDLEAAMEECLDQDMEVLWPAAPDATYVARATGELAGRYGPIAVVSLPLRRRGEVVAVLTLERPADRPFTLAEVESVRLACELCAPRLVNLYEHDRWFGARMAAAARKGLVVALGPKHTWKKVIALLVMGAAIFLVFAKGDYNAEATFVLEATERQVVPAPFDGYIEAVFVEPDSDVTAGTTVLARLKTRELELKVASAAARREAYSKQAAAAMRDGKEAEAQIARAQAEEVGADIALFEYQIGQAEIKSAISGKVVVGDLKRQIGAPVKTGTVMFEIAPINALRAELAVPENAIADVDEFMRAHDGPVTGALATTTRPDRRSKFTVERINPATEVLNQRNVVKVRARLDSTEVEVWMRPGLEGLAKIHLGRRSYAWLWTHRLIDWLRMKLWM